MEALLESLPLSVDVVKFVSCLTLSFPLGILFRKIPSPIHRHLYGITVGSLMLVWCFGLSGLISFLFGPLLVYGLMTIFPSRLAPQIAFVVMFASLSFLHIYRMATDWMGYSLDISGPAMVSLIKVTMFAWNYRDGKLLESPLALTPLWRKKAVVVLPTLLEFLGYVLFFPTIHAGPAFHMVDYLKFINGNLYTDPKHNPSGKFPLSTITRASLTASGIGLLSLCIHLVLDYFTPTSALFLSGLPLSEYSIVGKLVFAHFAIMGLRCRYYFAWKLSEGAGILAGLGFKEYDESGKVDLNGLKNVYISKCELAGSLRDITVNWNYATGNWLKNYVYFRTASNISERPPTWALYFTNTVSAFWHGFYPGYYLAFVKASFEIDIMRQLRRKLRPYVLDKESNPMYPQKYVYDLLGWLLSSLSFTSGLSLFSSLSFSNALQYAKNFLFLPFLFPIGLFVAVKFVKGTPRKDGKKKKDSKKEE
eukprot:TRINITY_DN816_c0_g1_i2.p1 TRINITY_DN816_c0_g1~~TRINITY_DN816_c0_g1_i2.p1  ORF type:complete len:491 (+),score=96.29 TRINITY_DN816_c0_g1_i2:42-1475(+)